MSKVQSNLSQVNVFSVFLLELFELYLDHFDFCLCAYLLHGEVEDILLHFDRPFFLYLFDHLFAVFVDAEDLVVLCVFVFGVYFLLFDCLLAQVLHAVEEGSDLNLLRLDLKDELLVL